ncbi:G-type lectin S-receptor-like serine/threonine-protein kinase At2g19130 [Carex rostrata]
MASPKPDNFLTFLFFLCLNMPSISFASDHISFNSSLSGNKTISSQGGKFELGFFRLGNKSMSPNYYLGIWYKKVPKLTPVWIANRNAPISNPNTSELRILPNGNMALLDHSKTCIWFTNVTSLSSNFTICTLLDTGNLVLKYSSNKTATYLWQSMDHPTDTWLPGAKLGRSKALGQQRLVSWKNPDDPAEGLFSFELDPNGSSQYLLSWNKSKYYWTGKEYNGKIFNLPKRNVSSGYFNFCYVSNENERYFTYSWKDDSIIVRFVLDFSGQIKVQTLVEESQAQCDVYALCGPFGYCDSNVLPYCSCVKGFKAVNPINWELGDRSEGCQRNSPLQCDLTNGSTPNEDNDQFFKISSVNLPEKPHMFNNASVKDCERTCLENCSCKAYAYNSNNCSIWYDNLLNMYQETSGSTKDTLFLRLSASEFKKPSHVKKEIIWVIFISLVCFLACTVVILLLVRWYERRRFVLATSGSENGLVAFRYCDLQKMTNNFSERLGGGSFGSVFKGTLPNSSFVAVKRLDGILRLGEKQFRNEVSTIGIVKHVNLVRLRGFCCEGDKRLLVYDYMENGSLDKLLFCRKSTLLNWNKRYKIALETARGLVYLHESCRDCIIQCDVKPENILLDELYVPKVADFGMAKLVGREFSRVLITLRGTIGYLAPEWISGVPISTKIDVYSYGMVLFELVSRRRNSELLEGKIVDYFPLLAALELYKGNMLAIVDPDLNGNANLEEVERVCRVACWCIQDEEHNRPTMRQVVQILEGVLEVSLPPIPRSLKDLTEDSANLNFFKEYSLYKSKDATKL